MLMIILEETKQFVGSVFKNSVALGAMVEYN